MADHPRTALVLAALRLALQRRWSVAGRIHHSAQGCQYPALAFGHHLGAAGLVPSTGTVGDGDGNAVAASFFASRKVGLVDRHDGPTSAAARVATLDYLRPVQFETRTQADIAA